MLKYYLKWKSIFLLSTLIYQQSFSQQKTDSCNFFCQVDINVDTVYYEEVPNKEFQLEILPSIFKLNLEHTRAYLNYTIPFDTLAKTTGLTLIFGKLLPECCECNGQKACASDVQFRKKVGTNCASFIWKTTSNKPFVKDTVRGHYKYTIRIPPTITGMALISPNLLKMQFSDDVIGIEISDLSQTTNGKPKTIVSYSILGIESSAWKAIIYPSCSKPFRIPNLPFYIQPK